MHRSLSFDLGVFIVMIVTSLILVTTTTLTLRNAGDEGLGLLS